MLRRLPHPSLCARVRQLHSFTRADLESIRAVLDPVPSFPLASAPPHTAFVQANGRPPADSAVLIPLMNIDQEAHILLQIRSATLRVHAGEARWAHAVSSRSVDADGSFPGGKADPVRMGHTD